MGRRVRADAVHALELSRLAVAGGDGRRDIVDSADDALASTANYFVKSGWRSGVPWGFEVKLPPGYSGPSGRKAKQPMSAWAARGIARIDGRPLGRGRRGTAAARRPRRPGVSGHAQFRRGLFLQRRRILFAGRLRAGRSPRGRTRASSRPGRPTIPASRASSGANCRRCWRGTGYDVGEPDGAIGAKTKQAIADFQGKQGMPVNGRASQKVLEALRR